MTVQGHGWDDNTGYPAFRNIIINGGMSIAQRNTSVASITTGNYYTADRWNVGTDGIFGTWTQSVENDAPTGSGLRKSLKMLCTVVRSSLSANDALVFEQRVEGQNIQHLAKGTSSTKSITISFWVKSNVTGTYIVRLRDHANSRHISAAYTINASATWQKETITFTGDTAGIINNDNTTGLAVQFWLLAGSNYSSGTLATSWAAINDANCAVGQVNLAGTVSNYWQVTGVQLEAGPVATPFEFEPFETTLRKCQRYFISYGGGGVYEPVALGFARGATAADVTTFFPVEMRIPPTASVSAAGDWQLSNGVTSWVCTTISNYGVQSGKKISVFGAFVASGLTNGAPLRLEAQNRTTSRLNFNAEL